MTNPNFFILLLGLRTWKKPGISYKTPFPYLHTLTRVCQKKSPRLEIELTGEAPVIMTERVSRQSRRKVKV